MNADELLEALELQQLGPDVFRTTKLWTPTAGNFKFKARGTFGGHIVALACEAMRRTADPAMSIHSIHSRFVRPSNSDLPMDLFVTRIRDGRSLSLRMVQCKQREKIVFLATAGFHRNEKPNLKHTAKMPNVKPGPDGSSRFFIFNHKLVTEALLSPALESRTVNPGTLAMPIKSTKPQYSWVRAALVLPKGQEYKNLMMGCWFTDYPLAWTVYAPHGLPSPHIKMLTSLDHNIYFHTADPFHCNEWYLFESISSWADHNRCVCQGRVFRRTTGEHVMTIVAELITRSTPGFYSEAKL